MKKLSIVLLLVIVLLGGCTVHRMNSTLTVESVTLTELGTWRVFLVDEYGWIVKVYLVFEEQPDVQAGDRVQLVKVRED